MSYLIKNFGNDSLRGRVLRIGHTAALNYYMNFLVKGIIAVSLKVVLLVLEGLKLRVTLEMGCVYTHGLLVLLYRIGVGDGWVVCL